jgi:hypothetical protein
VKAPLESIHLKAPLGSIHLKTPLGSIHLKAPLGFIYLKAPLRSIHLKAPLGVDLSEGPLGVDPSVSPLRVDPSVSPLGVNPSVSSLRVNPSEGPRVPCRNMQTKIHAMNTLCQCSNSGRLYAFLTMQSLWLSHLSSSQFLSSTYGKCHCCFPLILASSLRPLSTLCSV